MRILVYCQHVLGIGHLIRTFEILKALDTHQVTLLLGGTETDIPIPHHVDVVYLPPLMMDREFSSLHTEGETSLGEVKQKRVEHITTVFSDFQPDILLVELYPFGRNAFHFELEPLLQLARKKPGCLTASSVRDILVERDNKVKFEQRVIDRLNTYFDLLLVHSDPDLIRLDTTFSRMPDILIPVVYTGYVNRPPATDTNPPFAGKTGGSSPPLIIASAGGGSVGFALLEATLKAHRLLAEHRAVRLHLYTGPYLGENERRLLQRQAAETARIRTFSDNLPAELVQADLSISMGGYNTTMDVITAGCSALIYPFDRNHEQRMRAERFSSQASITVLDRADLEPAVLADHMLHGLNRPGFRPNILMNGARKSAQVLLSAMEGKPNP